MGCAPTAREQNRRPAGLQEQQKIQSKSLIVDPKLIKKMMDHGSLSDTDFQKLSKGDVKVKKNLRPTLKHMAML